MEFKQIQAFGHYFCSVIEQIGHIYQIIGVRDPQLEARLVSMGIYEGKWIKIHRKAPMGGAYYLEVDGCHYAFREDEVNALDLRELEKGEQYV